MKKLTKWRGVAKVALLVTSLLAVVTFAAVAYFAPFSLVKLCSSAGIDEVVYNFEMTDDREVVLKSFLGRTIATYQQSTEPIAANVLYDPTFVVRPIVNNDAEQNAQSIVKRKYAYGITYWRDGSDVVATAAIFNGKVFVLFYN